MYSKKVMQHFLHPKNMGKIKNPDGIGKVGNPICGDVMWLYIKVKNNIIKDIKFQTFGCVAAISTSSMITQLAKGKEIKKALEITKNDIADSLEGLPPIKLHCSVLAIEALSDAIYNYLYKNKLKIPKSLADKHKKVKATLESIEKRQGEYVKLRKM